MPLITGTEVASAVSKRIRDNFTAEEIKTIYINKPNQDAEENKPYAFIGIVDVMQNPELRQRANRSYIVEVRIHPPTYQDNINTWAAKIGEKLCFTLKDILVLDYPVKAVTMEYRVIDDVLIFTGTYRFKVIESVERLPFMETLETNFYGQRG